MDTAKNGLGVMARWSTGVMKCWSDSVSAMLCPGLESRSFADGSHHSATPILHYCTTVNLRQSVFICGLSSSRPFAVFTYFLGNFTPGHPQFVPPGQC